MKEERFNQLMTAFLEGDIVDPDLQELHQAVHASPEWHQRFQEETRLQVMMREALMEQVEIQSLNPVVPFQPPDGSRGWRPARWAMAAVVTLGALLAGIWFYGDTGGSRSGLGTCLYVSGDGQVQIERGSKQYEAHPDFILKRGDRVISDSHSQVMLRLLDGSILSMEPDSRLLFVSDQPQVKLEQGEALFEITERSENQDAFKVLTGQSTVTVLGTMFALQANDHTQVQVYEGRVTFTRHSDKASVEVTSEQWATTDTGILKVEHLVESASVHPVSVLSLLPTDDITLDWGEPVNGALLKVEGKRRTAYLRFVVPSLGNVLSAKLRLTQTIDPGSGTLSFHQGEHSDWSEITLDESTAPDPIRLVARRSGVVNRNRVIEVDVSSVVQAEGPFTLIMTLDRTEGHDIWFGSRESDVPPQLILTFQPPDALSL